MRLHGYQRLSIAVVRAFEKRPAWLTKAKLLITVKIKKKCQIESPPPEPKSSKAKKLKHRVRPALIMAILLCVSSEAVFVMRVGLSVGEVEQPSPSNRLYAALL